MKTTVSLIQQQLTTTNVATKTTDTGIKFCHIAGTYPSGHGIKPIAFLMSDERNMVEQFILSNTLYRLTNLLGYQPEINILSGQSNRDIQAQCVAHITKTPRNYSAVVTLSPWTGAHAHQEIAMNGVHLPLLFANLPTPNLKEMVGTTWSNGVGTQVQDYAQQLLTIRDLLPNLRRILIPHDTVLHGVYDKSNIETGNIAALSLECDRQNLEPVYMGMPPENRLAHDIKQYNSKDTLFIMTRESSVVSQMDDIIKACNYHHMPIFSDLPLPTLNGAAFGCGNSGIQIAEPLAEMIYRVVTEERLPSKMQSVFLGESKTLLYNATNFMRQGITPNAEQLRLLEAQEIMLFAHNQEML